METNEIKFTLTVCMGSACHQMGGYHVIMQLKKLITTKKYGTGVYTVKVFHANTANIGYTLTIKGPNAIGIGEGDGGCTMPATR